MHACPLCTCSHKYQLIFIVDLQYLIAFPDVCKTMENIGRQVYTQNSRYSWKAGGLAGTCIIIYAYYVLFWAMSGMFTQLQQSGGVLTKQNMIVVLFMQMTHPGKTALKLLVVAMKCTSANKSEDPLCSERTPYSTSS